MTSITYKKLLNALKEIIKGTKWEGHVFSVGGCERDLILGRDIKDVDLVVDLINGGIRFAKWLEENGLTKGTVVVYENFGTAMFHLKDFPEIELEVVQTRKEAYRDPLSRNPDTSFGTIEEDAHRRDFTCNAIYYNISKEKREAFNENSFDDINNKIIRSCGPAEIIFNEDPLRVLRAIRFSTTLDFKIEDKTLLGMHSCARRLIIISNERKQEELNKILTSEKAPYGMGLIFLLGVDKYLFPCNILDDKDCPKKIVDSLGDVKILVNDLDVKLAVLYSHFTDVSKKMKYLHYSNERIATVTKLIRLSDLITSVYIQELSPKNLRKIQYECGDVDTFVKVCEVYSGVTGHFPQEVAFRTHGMVANDTSMFNYKLPIDGNFIMKVKNIGPSKEVKKYLDFCYEMALINPSLTEEDFEKLLKYN